jgi:cation diffusion facilitator CzcD-associated flavoprotein CzcO
VTNPSNERRPLRIAIIGAGPGGLCMAIQLKRAGFEDIVILEKAGGVGGTWQHNLYPGCACDIPSYLYSFSFEIKRDWPRPYAPQPAILEYFESIAKKYDLLKHCRFGASVTRAVWNDEVSSWRLDLESGEPVEAEIVVSAIGMFNELAYPEIDGLELFEGKTFHSARWDWDYDLRGKTIGVIGSAASAVQFVPEIVKEADQVYFYQRTANWVLPKLDTPFTEEEMAYFRDDPDAASVTRKEIYDGVDETLTFSDPIAVAELEAQGLEALETVEDPELRAKLRPDHPFGCKRPLLSNDFYQIFNRSNLELVTEPIERISPSAVVTADGRERSVDALILATGFKATEYLMAIDVTGRRGLRLEDAWSDGAQAYLGISTPGFPNLFMLYGPNTNNGSIITMIEAQVDYVVRHVEHVASNDLAWVDVRPEVSERYNEEIQDAIDGVKAWQAGCNGYYRTPSGRVVTQWPHSMTEFRRRVGALDIENFETAPR